jgi:hypothetical protein
MWHQVPKLAVGQQARFRLHRDAPGRYVVLHPEDVEPLDRAPATKDVGSRPARRR